MRFLFIILLIGCSKDDKLSRVCPVKCYTGPSWTAYLGVCKIGKPVCDEKFNVIECVGEVVPSPEVCDGLDNDCDGFVDGGLYNGPATYWRDGLNPCILRGECNKTYVSCINEIWTCEYPSTVELDANGNPSLNETVCDNRDNNCNSLVDDVDYTNKYCYSGASGTAGILPCHPGILACIYGQEKCINEIVPQVERCNGLDDNCNGLVDDTDSVLASKFDNVYVYDTSGSMCEEIDATIIATDRYVDTYINNSNFKFALVVMSNTPLPLVRLLQNFTDIATFRNVLLSLNCSGGAYEASYDSIYAVCDLQNNPLGLNWRPDAIAMYYGFTDENAQSYSTPTVTEDEVASICEANGVIVFQWNYFQSDFDDICNRSGGGCFGLSDNYQDILDDLNSIATAVCNGI